MAFNFQRPNLPYEGESLQNDKRYELLEAQNKPPTAKMLDADCNFLTDAVRTLDDAIAGISIGTIPGAGLPENANKLPVTDGATNISWVLISDPYVEVASLSGSRLIPGTITANEMMDGTIPKSKMGPKAIGTSNMEDEAVIGTKVAQRTLPGSKMILHTITNDEMDDDAIDTDNVKDLAITTDKMADGAITAEKMADGDVAISKLATEVLNLFIPIGTVIEVAGASAPSANFLECNGQPVSRATYAALFASLGVTYGSGNGTTTFNLPDRRGRTGVGIGSDNSTGSRITAATASNINLGGTFGAETHTLTVPEMPSHTHNVPSTFAGSATGAAQVTIAQIGNINTNPTGGDQPHNNVQPSIFMRYYIRAL